MRGHSARPEEALKPNGVYYRGQTIASLWRIGIYGIGSLLRACHPSTKVIRSARPAELAASLTTAHWALTILVIEA